MTGKLRKAVAFLLIAVLFVQQCSVISLAGEEEAVEEQEEALDQEMQEPEVTEPEPSETPATETPVPETPATEPQTTEAPAPETQATEAPAPETQATETQADTAESEEKAETEAEPESETEPESESETERSDRENTGDPVTGSDLAAMLSSALPYLFVTKDLSFPADKEESSIPGDWILDGDDGSGVVSDLKSTATILADATSSFDVTVINLYADENGSLDTAQLDAIFPDQVIDVTNTYYLVNVIADSQTQEFSFSGFAMKEDGETLAYTEETQPGAVLYNFAAYDETSYQDYTGTLHLSGGFQGTVLAPAASVHVEGDLSGAAYADQVTVTDATADLMKIVFYDGIEEEKTETESETEELQTEVFTETETEVLEEEGTEEDSENNTETVLTSTIKPLDSINGIITVTADVRYGETVLSPVEDIEDDYFVALFIDNEEDNEEDNEDYTRVESVDPEPLKFMADSDSKEGTCELTYKELDDSKIYYVLATDEDGEPINEGAFSAAPSEVKFADDGLSGTAKLDYVYSKDWGGLFYYPVSLELTINVTNRNDKDLNVNETFYAKVYNDSETYEAKFVLNNENSKTDTSLKLKATAPEQTFYIEEVDGNGKKVVAGENGFAYKVSYPDTNEIAVECGDTSAASTIVNKLNDSTIILKITDKYGNVLSDATFAVKNTSGEIITKIYNGENEFKNTSSKTSELKDGDTYYLYEINASSGYTPKPALEFTVKAGLTTEITLINEKTEKSDYDLTVSKAEYAGENEIYAYNTTDTFYVALFSDKSHTKKVSNVQTITIHNSSTGSTIFSNLEANKTYYVAETDEDGVAKSDTKSLTIQYSDSNNVGKTTMSKTKKALVIKNIYSSLPSNHRYIGYLTIDKNVVDSAGTAKAVTETFYAGLFRNSDYSDSPIVIALDCKNSSTASATRRILLSGEDSVTYYIAEVDANGNRITDNSDFSYKSSVSPQSKVIVTKGSDQKVTITNQEKASNKVTLTLSKRVYEGSDPLPVDETFYVGLFKDENLTTPYTSPIAMNLSDADSLTLKLTLNIGNKTDATVYIAEVDASGNLVQSSKEFGYSCHVANNEVVFSQSRKSAQSVLVNFVYGTDTQDAINSVLEDLGEYFGDEDFTFDENGDFYGDGSVDTGDTTPIAGCVAVMAASMLIFVLSYRRRRRAR